MFSREVAFERTQLGTNPKMRLKGYTLVFCTSICKAMFFPTCIDIISNSGSQHSIKTLEDATAGPCLALSRPVPVFWKWFFLCFCLGAPFSSSVGAAGSRKRGGSQQESLSTLRGPGGCGKVTRRHPGTPPQKRDVRGGATKTMAMNPAHHC